MRKIFAALIIGVFVIAGCNKTAEMERVEYRPSLKVKPGDYIIPVFDPDNMRIPFPNDLLIDKTTGKVNIPVLPTDTQAETMMKWQLNTLDGFSTSTTIYVDFTYPISLTSVEGNVLIINTKKFTSAIVSGSPVTDAIVPFTAEFEPLGGKNRLILHPLHLLEPSTQYVVILKKGIRGINGKEVSPSPVYLFLKNDKPLYNKATSSSTLPALSDEEAKQLEEMREQLQDLFTGLEKTGLATKDDILFLWSFTTLSVGKTLKKIVTGIVEESQRNPSEFEASFDDGESKIVPAICVYAPDLRPDLCGALQPDPHLRALYDLFVSSGYGLQVSWVVEGYFYTRNYRALLGYFSDDLSYLPEKIRFILTIPSGRTLESMRGMAQPVTDPFPVIIYQHGITRNKNDIFLVANGFALAGFATFAIDLPDHGERREGDVDINGDGTPDGDRFIDPSNILTTRDRMRQAVVDLEILTQVIKHWKFDVFYSSDNTNWTGYGNGVTDLPAKNPYTGEDEIYFVGHSLGAIIGGVFMAMSPDVKVGVLNSGGGEVARLIATSPAFAGFMMQSIAGTLGMDVNSNQFKQFWYDYINSVQWIVDGADPANYARYWSMEPLYTAGNQPVIKKILLVGSRFDPVVPDANRDLLAVEGGLISDYSDLLTESVLPPSLPLDKGGYVVLNSYKSYTVDVTSLPPYFSPYIVDGQLNIGSPSLLLTPARVNPDLSLADCTPADPTGCVAYLPFYLEMYNEMDSFLATGGNYIKISSKSDYLPDTATCTYLGSNPAMCTDPRYQLACYLCQYWDVPLVWDGR